MMVSNPNGASPGWSGPPAPAPQAQAALAQQQYLRDMQQQSPPSLGSVPPGSIPGSIPPSVQPSPLTAPGQVPPGMSPNGVSAFPSPSAMDAPSGPPQKAGASHPPAQLPYGQLNQTLVQGDSNSRLEAMALLAQEGFAPSETYTILCQLAQSAPGSLPPGVSEEDRSHLRQAAFWTRAVEHGTECSGSHAGTHYERWQAGCGRQAGCARPIVVRFTGSPSCSDRQQRRPGCPARRCTDAPRNSVHTSRRQDHFRFLKAAKPSDSNVKAMIKQVLSINKPAADKPSTTATQNAAAQLPQQQPALAAAG